MKILFALFGKPEENTGSTTRINGLKEAIESEGISVDINYFDYYNPPKSLLSSFNILNYISKSKIIKKYEIIHAHSYYATFLSIPHTKILKKKLVFDVHGDLIAEQKMYNSKKRELLLNKLIERINFKAADANLFVSKIMLEKYKREHNPKNAVYAPNGVNLDRFRPGINTELKKKLGLENKLVIGYVGQFQKWQGIEKLIECAKQITEDNIRFLFIGGDENKQIRNCIFHSTVDFSRITDYLNACDILTLPREKNAVTEVAAPTKFAEYCAVGKPVLITNVGDAVESVKKYKNGIIAKDNSVGELKKAVMEMTNLSDKKIAAMGKNSRRLAEKEFDWNRISKTYIKEVVEKN